MTIRRILLIIGGLLVLLLVAGWWWLFHSESGARFIWSRAETATGGALYSDEIHGTLSSELVIDGLRYRTESVLVSVERVAATLELGIRPMSVGVRAARVRGVSVLLADVTTDRPPSDVATIIEKLALPFELIIDDLQAEQLDYRDERRDQHLVIDAITLTGRWHQDIEVESLLATQNSNHASVSGSLQLARPQHVEALAELRVQDWQAAAVTSLEAAADIRGPLEDYEFTLTTELVPAGYSKLAGDARGGGSLRSIAVESLAIQGDDVTAKGSGHLSWAQGIEAAATLEVSRADLNRLWQEWPAESPLQGSLSLHFADQVLRLEESQLSAANSRLQATAEGIIDLAGGAVGGDLNWEHFAWPLTAAEPRIASRRGDVRLDGTLDAWTVTGRVALAAAGVDDGTFQVEARGDREQAEALITEGQVLGGRIAGNVAGSWVSPQPWSVDLALNGIRPAAVWPQFEGALSGAVIANGQMQPFEFNAQLDAVNGTFKGRPLSASGGLQLAANELSADDLVIRNGSSEVLLNGSLDSAEGVRFEARSEQIGQYLDTVAGDFAASGTLRMQNDEPMLEATASSQHLTFGDTELLGSTLDVTASAERQQATLTSRYNEMRLELALDGAVDDWRSPQTWRGTVQEFLVDAPAADDTRREIRLREATGLSIAADKAEIERFCLDGALDAEVCGNLSWRSGEDLELNADIDVLPVNHINQVFDTGFSFEQTVTGSVRLEKTARGFSGSADIRTTPGTIQSNTRDDIAIDTGTGTMRLQVQDGVLLTGNIDLPLPGTGEINGSFSVTDVVDFRDSAIDGNIDIAVSNLALLQVLVPAIDDASGDLQSNIRVSGTAAEPQLSGELHLQNGSLGYRPIGLQLDDIELRSTIDQGRRFELEGDFRAGEGRGHLRSRGRYGDAAANGLMVELTGENLTIIDVPDVQATANPDLRIGYRDGSLRIDGKVLVPYAQVEPRSLPTAGQSVSDDVVIVAGELPGESPAATDSKLALNGTLELTLGDDVAVELDLAKAKVTGTTRFTWDGAVLPMAEGRFDIAGDVQAYGQVLTITEGRIRFSKVPADNPTLRIRAEREIFGNSQVKRAGVLVAGTAKQPSVEAYTDPRTTEERALTLLVTGSDFDMEQGVGAVDFGTYIAPKLFVSYGVGLFDQENVISARYDLGKGFGLKATSGQKESGVDLIYRIER